MTSSFIPRLDLATFASNGFFHTCFDAKCLAFKITRLIYVHCISKEEFSANLKGVECVILHCKEMCWGYLESVSERRIALIPTFVDDKTAEELFAGLRSPVLIRINCSCDITVSTFYLFMID